MKLAKTIVKMPPLRIHYFQHVPFEGIASLADWIGFHKYSLSSTKFYENEIPPQISSFDWLIIMGGPMSVNDEEQFTWLKKEKEFIRDAIAQNKTVIGICLGSQLIAAALGASVYPNKQKEIGWFPVENPKDMATQEPVYQIPNGFTVFHWHGDTFDLPRGAVHLFRSEACLNQGFLYKDNVVALQFHFEANAQSVDDMITHGKAEIETGGLYIQTMEFILNHKDYSKDSNKKMLEILTHLKTLKKS